MINLDHSAKTIRGAFNIPEAENKVIEEIRLQCENIGNSHPVPLSWVLQRVWVEERLSDNARAYLIFTLGRWYEVYHSKKGDADA